MKERMRRVALVGLALALVGLVAGCPVCVYGAFASSRAGDSLEIVGFDPAPGTDGVIRVPIGEQLNVHVDYTVAPTQGARIFVRPLTGGSLTPDYWAHPSPLYTGSGAMSGWFGFDAASTVDQVRVEIEDDTGNEYLTLILNINAVWE